MSKIFKVNSLEFKLMSSAHLQVLVSQGFEIVISDVVNAPAKAETATSRPAKAEQPAKAPAKADSVSKGSKTTNKNVGKKPTDNKQIKVGCFVKVTNTKTNKVVMAGKVKNLDKANNAVVLTNTKMYSLENCSVITENEFKRLKKSLKVETTKADDKASTSTRLNATDYKVIYAYNLCKLGKISEADFEQAKTDVKVASELYTKFKAEVKLSNAEAMKLLAENSAKSAN